MVEPTALIIPLAWKLVEAQDDDFLHTDEFLPDIGFKVARLRYVGIRVTGAIVLRINLTWQSR